MDEGFRYEDEDAVGATGQVEAVQDEAGFDGFSEANFIGEQHAGEKPICGLCDDGELVWDEVDACASVTTRGRAANVAVPAQGFEALVEISGVIGEPGEQAFFGADEGQ